MLELEPHSRVEAQVSMLSMVFGGYYSGDTDYSLGPLFEYNDAILREPRLCSQVEAATFAALAELPSRERIALSLRFGLEGRLTPSLRELCSYLPRLDGQGSVKISTANEIVRGAFMRLREPGVAERIFPLLPTAVDCMNSRLLGQFEIDIRYLQATYSAEFIGAYFIDNDH